MWEGGPVPKSSLIRSLLFREKGSELPVRPKGHQAHWPRNEARKYFRPQTSPRIYIKLCTISLKVGGIAHLHTQLSNNFREFTAPLKSILGFLDPKLKT